MQVTYYLVSQLCISHIASFLQTKVEILQQGKAKDGYNAMCAMFFYIIIQKNIQAKRYTFKMPYRLSMKGGNQGVSQSCVHHGYMGRKKKDKDTHVSYIFSDQGFFTSLSPHDRNIKCFCYNI
mmetsp:Transcript_15933/g.23666  ORF Transcript_15933/g.23666 Transcript_15933/m.23666 type:complete len:123 (+) Transcript_15933:908-1276(+)